MSARLGGSQISSLLESVPGIASVLRSPVADAIVSMVRAGAGLDPFDLPLAKELVQYAVRRGLLPMAEGDELLEQVEAAVGKGRKRKTPPKKKPARPAAAKKAPARKKKPAKSPKAKPVAKKTTKRKPAAKKTTKKRR